MVRDYANDASGAVAPHVRDSVVAVPAGIYRSADRLIQVMYDCAMEVDVAQMLRWLRSLLITEVPTIGLGNDTNALWSVSDGFPVVHLNDSVAMAAMPWRAETVGTQWTFEFTTVSTSVLNRSGESNTVHGAAAIVFKSAPSTTDQAIHASLRTRPICAKASLTDTTDRVCIWIDGNSAPAKRTDVTFTSLVTMRTATAWPEIPNLAVNYVLTRVDEDGFESASNYTSAISAFSALGDNQYAATSTVTMAVVISGFYMIEADTYIQPMGEGTPPTIESIALNGRCDIHERVAMSTCFVTDDVAKEFAPLSTRHWLHGSALLGSLRSPSLTSAGSILGANVRRVYPSWVSALPHSAGSIISKVDPNDTYRGAEGGKLQDGVFTWAKVTALPTVMSTTAADDGDVTSVLLPVARIVSGPGTTDGQSILYFNPAMTGELQTTVMRFTFSRKISYVPRSRLIATTGAAIPILLTDEVDVLMMALSRMNNFDHNDWHDSVKKWCANIGRAAAAVFRVARFGGHVVEAAVPLLASL